MSKIWVLVDKTSFSVIFASADRLEVEEAAKVNDGYILQVFDPSARR